MHNNGDQELHAKYMSYFSQKTLDLTEFELMVGNFEIFEAASTMSSKLQSSFDFQKRKLRSLIYSSYDDIKECVYTSLLLFKSMHKTV